MTGNLSFSEMRDAVVAALARAASTLRRLPMPAHGKPSQLRSSWPAVPVGQDDAADSSRSNFSRIPPSARAISELDQVLPWFSGLDVADRRIVWARAAGLSWPKLARRAGLSVGQVRYRWNGAIDRIVAVAVHDAIVSKPARVPTGSACKSDHLGR